MTRPLSEWTVWVAVTVVDRGQAMPISRMIEHVGILAPSEAAAHNIGCTLTVAELNVTAIRFMVNKVWTGAVITPAK